MKLFKLSLLLTIIFALCAAAHAEVVGRVLMAAGDASIIRNNRELRVAVGSPVEDKDTLKTGPFSNMQVRLTDESVVSLRDHSLLKIDEYKFTGKQDGMEKAFFNLVKGGFRTITGVIGRVNKTNYGVKTATATIGIRGTNFALLHCTAGNCGAAAKDGLYGGVSGGIIAASNRTGEYQFGSGDYFYVPSEDAPAQKLIGPPGFLADQLAGQSRGGKPSSGTGNEQAQNGGAASDSSPNKLTSPPPEQAFIVTENLCVNGFPCVLSLSSVTPTPPVLPPANNTVMVLAWATNQTAGFDTVLVIPPPTTTSNITLSGSQMIAYVNGGSIGTLGTGIVDGPSQGNDPVGNMFWGRWVGVAGTSTSVTVAGQTFMATPLSPAPGVPYIFGALATSVPNPTSPTVNVPFSFAGGNIVDASGNVGTLTSIGGSPPGGSLSVNFTTRSVNMASPLTFDIGGLSYSMTTFGTPGASYPSATQPQITGTLSGTCSGGVVCGTPTSPNASGPVSAHFTGATGAGLGIALATVITSPAEPVALAVGYKCPTC